MKCKNWPTYQEFEAMVLTRADWLEELQRISTLEEIARCIESLYLIPAIFFPAKIPIIVKYRKFLLDIYDFLIAGGSLLSWVRQKGITYKTAEEILRVFGFGSVKELLKIPERNELYMLPPKFIPWTNNPAVSSLIPSVTLKLIRFKSDTWEKIEKQARKKRLTPSELIERIVAKNLK